MPRPWRLILSPLACLLLAACGSEEADPADELGIEDPDRYELVIVDEDSAGQESAPPVAPAEAAEAVEAVEAADQVVDEVVDATTADEAASAIRFDPQGQFTVQIGLYRDAKAAGKFVRQLSKDGYPAYAIASPGGKGVRVRIGYFGSRQQAQGFGARLKKDRGYDFWVDRRANEAQ